MELINSRSPFFVQLASEYTTNELSYSEDFNNWGDVGVTITPNAIVSPDGTTNASKFVSTANNWRKSSSFSGSAGVTYTVSIYAKLDTSTSTTTTRLEVYNGAGSLAADYNLLNETISNSGFTSVFIEPVEDDWYRIGGTYTAGGTNNILYIYPSEGYGTAGTMYFWGAQLEEGSSSTSYLPTEGSSVERDSTITSAFLDISIHQGEYEDFPTPYTYSLTKTFNNERKATFEIADLLRDYIEETFSGDYESNLVWADVTLTDSLSTWRKSFLVTEGYNDSNFVQYFSTGLVSVKEDSKLISNNVISLPNDTAIVIPVTKVDTVSFLKEGEVKFTWSSSVYDIYPNQVIEYATSSGQSATSFYTRVIKDGGTIVDQHCSDDIMEHITELDIDTVYIAKEGGGTEVVKVDIQACSKFDISKLTFVNRFGALQDVHFNAKSTEQSKVNSDSYKAFNFDYNNLTSNHDKHNNIKFNINGEKTHTLNTNFVHEDYSDVFEQLLLSEKVWYEDSKGIISPVTVEDSSLTRKTHLNDGLIQFSIKIKESSNIINNIR